MKREDKQCRDCGSLGDKVPCGECAGGYGWTCKADKHGQHVHKNMRACVDFNDKSKSLDSDTADEYMGQIECDVHNGDTTLSDLQALQRKLDKYVEKFIHE